MKSPLLFECLLLEATVHTMTHILWMAIRSNSHLKIAFVFNYQKVLLAGVFKVLHTKFNFPCLS